MSPATVDRLLSDERKKAGRGKSTTKAGNLLKKQITVRTFAEWNNVVPGFLEADLVAHCGETVEGHFLNTLVLTDIASGWTEFLPLMYKNEANVLEALRHAKDYLLPMPLQGLDTDNGSEFINYSLLRFCQNQKITFTRSRPYKKNDQAHVEEKNGSIIRKMVGYDRYEGATAYVALGALYERLRLYVNFFQPSMKLLSKKRVGAKIHKTYDRAQTPYQRILKAQSVTDEDKLSVQAIFETLDPVGLFEQIEQLQEDFWKLAWKKEQSSVSQDFKETLVVVNTSENASGAPPAELNVQRRRYRKSQKPRKQASPRNFRTKKDPFELVKAEIETLLNENSCRSATGILCELQQRYPGKFADNLRRTMQRRVQRWKDQKLPTKIPTLVELLPQQPSISAKA